MGAYVGVHDLDREQLLDTMKKIIEIDNRLRRQEAAERFRYMCKVREPTQQKAEKNKLRLELHRQEQTKSVVLPCLTNNEVLCELITVQMRPNPCDSDSLHDYEAFLQRTLVFDDEVLSPILICVKEYLEHLQEVLGDVDDWLKAAGNVEEFVKEALPYEPEDDGLYYVPRPPNMTIEDKFYVGGGCVMTEMCDMELTLKEDRKRFLSFAEYVKSWNDATKE